jgi:diguanylate cyclase (GGDEF)-like protein
MEEFTFRNRAVAFATCAGMTVFLLALLAMARGASDDRFAGALLAALACGGLTWLASRRAFAGVADAVDRLAARLSDAADGDLVSPTPEPVRESLPHLSAALESLLAQVRSNLDSVHALALFDPVTALPNRLHFRREAERLIGDSGDDAQAALLFIDLDRFKAVNDSFGHAVGDQLLLMVANRLRHVLGDKGDGDSSIVARLAGDEFTFFSAGTGAAEAARCGRRVLAALSEPFDLSGVRVELGASVGIALYPDHGRDLAALMRAADIAMYQAKAEGRGRQILFSPELAAQLDGRLSLDRELRDAVDKGEFALHFQPLSPSQGGGAAAVEALLRWEHPVRGTRMPAEFIAAAEESGLMIDIGDWVIDAAAATLGRWTRAGRQMRIAINVSPRQIEQPGFFAKLRHVLASHDAPLDLFELEISETTAMQCSPAVLAGFADLRADGVTVAIDDFGTGYSNLARLKDVPVDRVKLDRSLTHDVAESAEARILVHSVVGLVHALGYAAVAEGVEGRYQSEVLRAIGCDLLQGYAIAPPMPEGDLLAWIGGPPRLARVG